MERGTRIELATNSVEGCDSTIELPPPFQNSIVGNERPLGQTFPNFGSHPLLC